MQRKIAQWFHNPKLIFFNSSIRIAVTPRQLESLTIE